MVKEKSLVEKVPVLMHMKKNRHLHCPTGTVSPATHDIWNIHLTIKRKAKHKPKGKASVCKKRQTWRVSAPMESRHVGWIDSCVYSFCSCATSVPRHNLTSWPLCWSIYHQEASHTRQAIPTEPMQEPEFVVPLCNAVTGLTWKTDWCSVQLCVKCNHRWAVEEYWSYM